MAKRFEVLLMQDVLKVGNMGDVVKVAPGFARNYLFPYELAIPVSMAHKRQVEVLRERASKNEVEREGKAGELKKKLLGLRLRLGARVVADGELFGSIGARDIVAEIAKLGFAVDTKQVHLGERFKKLGTYQVELKLHRTTSVDIVVEIYDSDPNSSIGEAIAASKPEAKADDKAAAVVAPKPAKTKVKNLGRSSVETAE